MCWHCKPFLELDKRRFNGVLAKETLLLVVEDPRKNVGSGSATLNALLVTAEHLSAKMGFTVSFCWKLIV